MPKRLSDYALAIPLAQIEAIVNTDAETKEAVADWHYWLSQGYEV